MLTVTNGDSAVGALKAAGIDGHIFPWRDVLHEGPVPADLSLEQLSAVRARFIAGRGWGRGDDVARDFRLRDEKLASAAHHDELVLWFEHDLYDQLQLLQILDRLAEDPDPLEETSISLICHDTFIAHATPDRLRAWHADRPPVSDEQYALARRAWTAFRAPSPVSWAALLNEDTGALPFLANTVERHLQEFPGTDGLSRTERQLLEALAEGADTPRKLFPAVQRQEEAAFMGDASFWTILAGLAGGPDPAVRAQGISRWPPAGPVDAHFLEQPLEITRTAERILAGSADWATLFPLDKWLGGVHLTGPEWRWDRGARQLLSS